MRPIPGIVILVVAFFLSLIVSVSLPLFTAMDIIRVNAPNSPLLPSDFDKQQRYGIWGICQYKQNNDDSECHRLGHGYAIPVMIFNADEKKVEQVVIGASWTRGLAVHPVATATVALALGLSLSNNVAHLLFASFASFFAALMTLIAFAIDIALLAYMHHKLDNDVINVVAGPGFWITFVTLILLLLGGCTVCFGHRKASGADTSGSFPMNMLRKLPFVKKNEWA